MGKTASAKTIASLLRPLSGAVFLDGVPTAKARDKIFSLPETIDVPDRIKAAEALASSYGAEESVKDFLNVVGVPRGIPTCRSPKA
ncbi:hypothetical protein Pogu_1096 [Pyrobaculum oguniense TE7]|uniref:ABC transporter domain-containing protein n=1 Tax=Pyrobaculum oguniense (strain DSM 13380 / JCM 10595 / TE7) TaxID=698757 RepID=H6Q8P1_PYROT|nr:hypothetical protein Pogu_1096 [Pyrobaculum oguniense TE7]